MLVGLDPFNPDAHGYLALSAALVAPGVAFVAAAALPALRRTALFVVVALLIALAGWRLVVNFDRCRLDRHWAAEENGRHVLAQAPGAVLFTSYFQTLFQSWSLRSTDDLRPDLTLVHRNFLNQPGYLEMLARREPSIQPQIDRWVADPRLRPRDLAELAAKRSVVVEYDINVGPELTERLWPAGIVLAYARQGDATVPAFSQHVARVARWNADIGPIDDVETRRSLTWTHYLLARFACERGLTEAARLHFDEGRRLAPRSRQLIELDQRCLPGRAYRP
jgi:hypothetical protein